jgi:hypothetical protein
MSTELFEYMLENLRNSRISSLKRFLSKSKMLLKINKYLLQFSFYRILREYVKLQIIFQMS